MLSSFNCYISLPHQLSASALKRGPDNNTSRNDFVRNKHLSCSISGSCWFRFSFFKITFRSYFFFFIHDWLTPRLYTTFILLIWIIFISLSGLAADCWRNTSASFWWALRGYYILNVNNEMKRTYFHLQCEEKASKTGSARHSSRSDFD